jgi:DNA ligase-4
VEVIRQVIGSTGEDVDREYQAAMDNREEGIIVKSLQSVYIPGSRKKDAWLKLKPDYVDGNADDLDVVMIGGAYGSGKNGGRLADYIVGVKTDDTVKCREDDGMGNVVENEYPVFKTFCRVGGGFSDRERVDLNAHLEPYNQNFVPSHPPPFFSFEVSLCILPVRFLRCLSLTVPSLSCTMVESLL